MAMVTQAGLTDRASVDRILQRDAKLQANDELRAAVLSRIVALVPALRET